jgi:hypothetical protein
MDRRIVRFWDVGGNRRFCQFDNGLYDFEWNPLSEGWSGEEWENYLRGCFDEISRAILAVLQGRLAPDWEDPELAAPRLAGQPGCAYASHVAIAGIEHEAWRPELYAAGTVEQFDNAADRVIRRALRNLRELPLCSVSGSPVNVAARIEGDKVIAVMICGSCK